MKKKIIPRFQCFEIKKALSTQSLDKTSDRYLFTREELEEVVLFKNYESRLFREIEVASFFLFVCFCPVFVGAGRKYKYLLFWLDVVLKLMWQSIS